MISPRTLCAARRWKRTPPVVCPSSRNLTAPATISSTSQYRMPQPRRAPHHLLATWAWALLDMAEPAVSPSSMPTERTGLTTSSLGEELTACGHAFGGQDGVPAALGAVCQSWSGLVRQPQCREGHHGGLAALHLAMDKILDTERHLVAVTRHRGREGPFADEASTALEAAVGAWQEVWSTFRELDMFDRSTRLRHATIAAAAACAILHPHPEVTKAALRELCATCATEEELIAAVQRTCGAAALANMFLVAEVLTARPAAHEHLVTPRVLRVVAYHLGLCGNHTGDGPSSASTSGSAGDASVNGIVSAIAATLEWLKHYVATHVPAQETGECLAAFTSCPDVMAVLHGLFSAARSTHADTLMQLRSAVFVVLPALQHSSVVHGHFLTVAALVAGRCGKLPHRLQPPLIETLTFLVACPLESAEGRGDDSHGLADYDGGEQPTVAAATAVSEAVLCAGFVALNATPQGHEHTIAIMEKLPMLAHFSVVEAYTRASRIDDALAAAMVLATSRENGWPIIPGTVTAALHALAVLIGRCGSPSQLPALAATIFEFRNPALWLSVFLDSVVSGLADRVNAGTRERRRSYPELVQAVDTMCGAVVAQRTPDANADTVVQLLQAACWSPQATQLVTTIVKHFDPCYAAYPSVFIVRESSLSALPRAQRATYEQSKQRAVSSERPTTLVGSFLQHAVLAHLRHIRRAQVAEHLGFLWKLDDGVRRLLDGDASISPESQLWECRACNRWNNARYAYCSCTALRFAAVLCPECGYVQDEHAKQCQACAAPLTNLPSDKIVPRVSWSCGGCGATNPSFQTTFCFRCHAATGPCAKTSVQQETCNACHSPNPLGFQIYPICASCGVTSRSMSRDAPAARLWQCDVCNHWAPVGLKRCPHCPQVELRPASRRRPMAPITCSSCGCVNANALQKKCTGCGAELEGNRPTVVDVCTECFTANPAGSSACRQCNATMSADGTDNAAPQTTKLSVRAQFRSCAACLNTNSPYNISCICDHCDAPLPFSSGPPDAVGIVASCEVFLRRLDTCSVDTLRHAAAGLLRELQQASTEAVAIARPLLDDVVGFLCGKFKMNEILGVVGLATTAKIAELARPSTDGPSSASPPAHNRCSLCMGPHADAVCRFNTQPWTCKVCAKTHSNRGLAAVMCTHCFEIREEVQHVTDAWICERCERYSPTTECFCVACSAPAPASDPIIVPFLPTRCGLCGCAHLEALCPACTAAAPTNVVDGEGTVCLLSDRYAFIQPFGTSAPEDRVYVAQALSEELFTGQRVTFNATVGDRAGQLKATTVRSSH